MSEYILFVMEVPKEAVSMQSGPPKAWKEFIGNKSSLWKTIEAEEDKYKLSDNVWMIPVHTGLPLLGELVEAAKHHKIKCKFLQLKDAPSWLFP